MSIVELQYFVDTRLQLAVLWTSQKTKENLASGIGSENCGLRPRICCFQIRKLNTNPQRRSQGGWWRCCRRYFLSSGANMKFISESFHGLPCSQFAVLLKAGLWQRVAATGGTRHSAIVTFAKVLHGNVRSCCADVSSRRKDLATLSTAFVARCFPCLWFEYHDT